MQVTSLQLGRDLLTTMRCEAIVGKCARSERTFSAFHPKQRGVTEPENWPHLRTGPKSSRQNIRQHTAQPPTQFPPPNHSLAAASNVSGPGKSPLFQLKRVGSAAGSQARLAERVPAHCAQAGGTGRCCFHSFPL